MSYALSPGQANLKLALWQSDADQMTSADVYAWLVTSGLPANVALRLHELLTYTKRVGRKVFSIGKIILLKILEFVKAHPLLVTGAGIGAVVGAAIASLIASIPFLGPLLSPIAALLGITITAAGAVIGHRLDKKFSGVGEDIFEVARLFFDLVIETFNLVFKHVVSA
jgi:hypothetical protein